MINVKIYLLIPKLKIIVYATGYTTCNICITKYEIIKTYLIITVVKK